MTAGRSRIGSPIRGRPAVSSGQAIMTTSGTYPGRAIPRVVHRRVFLGVPRGEAGRFPPLPEVILSATSACCEFTVQPGNAHPLKRRCGRLASPLHRLAGRPWPPCPRAHSPATTPAIRVVVCPRTKEIPLMLKTRYRVGLIIAGLAMAAVSLSTLPTSSVQLGNAAQSAPGKAAFVQLKQEQNQWCWAASGLSIAQYLGKGTNITQNQFCNLSRGLSQNGQCPNQAGYLQWVQTGYRAIGLGAGTTGAALSTAQVQTEITANRPFETAIYWTAGGGHAQVVYAYNASSQTMSYGDPWPASPTYAEMTYNSYKSNGQFRWAETLYQVGM
ncbi:hypothetical protein D5S17_13495 [Pseudonocardiaceae bacterium YIM PH 21723]|nr:hypothetical protein D5S17_13495 [Pseudonocardiaceae bacterium YIM PH 21723]